MFAMFKTLFSGAPSSPTAKTVDLEANLKPSPRGAGFGEIEYSAYANGDRRLEVKLRHATTSGQAVIAAAGARLCVVPMTAGRGDLVLATRDGDDVPECRLRDRVEATVDGATIFTGEFHRD